MKIYQKLIYFLISFLLCLYILAVFIKTTPYHDGINHDAASKFIDMVDGKAYKPYVSRALLPVIVNGITIITPQSIQNAFSNFADKNYHTNIIIEKLYWEKEYFYQYIVAALLMFLCFMGTAYIGPKFLVITCRIKDIFFNKIILLLLTLLLLPVFFRYTSYIYDPPQIFLFISCLYFIVVKDHKKFTLVFFFLCVNKETAILLIPIFAVTFYGDLKKNQYIIYLVLQCMIYLLIRVSISLIFKNNGGSSLEFHLFDHNRIILSMGLNFSDAFVIILLLILFTFQWKEKPVILKTAFLSTFIPLIILSILFGFIDEWRAFYEAYFPALGLSIDTFMRVRKAIGLKDN